MALNLGSAAIKNLKLGNANVSKVMLGTKQVWPTLWTPADLPGIIFWMDGSDATKFNLNGATVSEWSSSVGSVKFTQAASTLQPLYVMGGIDSSASQYLSSTNVPYPAGAGDFTLVAVMTKGVGASALSAVSLGLNSAWTSGAYIELRSDQAKYYVANTNETFLATLNPAVNLHILTLAKTGNSYLALNSNNNTSNTQPASAYSGFQSVPAFISAFLLDGSTVQSYDATGVYYQIAFAAGTSVADQERLQGAMAWKAGAQAQLHDGHPYRRVPPIK